MNCSTFLWLASSGAWLCGGLVSCSHLRSSPSPVHSAQKLVSPTTHSMQIQRNCRIVIMSKRTQQFAVDTAFHAA